VSDVSDGRPGEDGSAPAGADRVLAALRLLGGYPGGIKLNELATALHSPKSSVHRALAALRRADLVEQDADGRYRLSYGFLRLAFSYYERLDEVERVRPALTALAEYFGETTHFAVLHEAEIMYVAKVQPTASRIQMTSVIGGHNPAHCTGVGKVLLSYRLTSLDAVREFVKIHGPLERRTAQTIVDAPALHRDLSAIRRRGYGLDNEESETGINCLGLPLFLTSRAEPEGAISITALQQRNPVEKLAAGVEEARAIIRATLGDVVG